MGRSLLVLPAICHHHSMHARMYVCMCIHVLCGIDEYVVVEALRFISDAMLTMVEEAMIAVRMVVV